MARVRTSFRCAECGGNAPKWVGQCGECQQWNTVVDATTPTQRVSAVAPRSQARSITEIGAESVAHWPSGIAEFDRVLGGGVVPGLSLIHISEPTRPY